MESCRRIVAGRWQRALPGPGGEGMRYIQRGFVFPSFPRRGGAKRRGGFGAYHHPAACGGTLLDEEGIEPSQPCPAASPSSKTTPQSAPTTRTRSGNTVTK